MKRELLTLSPAHYERHVLHGVERSWMETNCYVDVWIEVLHALGLEPAAAGAFTLSTDFEGDQWTFFKIPPEDLRALYGIEVAEMNIWRGVLHHLDEQLALGRLLTVEADSFYLPDTFGVAYHDRHVKSTIVPQMLDRSARRLGYFHNAGYFELGGEDFDGLFHLGDPDAGVQLPPYVELVRLERLSRDEGRLVETARRLTTEHLGRRPADNPIERLSARVASDLSWLGEMGLEHFHDYAFGTSRQCGASAEMAMSFLRWLGRHEGGCELEELAARYGEIATGAKTVQLGLARVAAGRKFDFGVVFEEMARAWDIATSGLSELYGT